MGRKLGGTGRVFRLEHIRSVFGESSKSPTNIRDVQNTYLGIFVVFMGG